jgi:phage terminase large subunit
VTAPAVPNLFEEFLDRYENDPVLFVREVYGAEPYPDQLEMLEAYARRERRISKRSGHGPGKTTTLAWIIGHHAACRYRQKTVCTAPTSAQLFDALYSETVTWFNKLPPAVRDLFDIKSESIVLKADPEASFVSFRTASADKPEAIAGVHSDWVLIIIDEASGVPEPIFESGAGSMSGHNAVTILAGNPVRTSGLFFDTHNKPEVSALWTTFHTSSENHPNVSSDFVEQMKATYGEDSDAYRVRVLGEFPKGEADTLIPFELVQAALTRDVKPLPVRPIWGLDVGVENDPSCLVQRRGNVLDCPSEEFRADGDPMKIVGWVKGKWDTTLPSQRPSEINVDSIGLGLGVAYRLMELNLPARAVNVSESPAMKQQFMRLRDELGWKAREWFQKRDCNLCGDKALAAELVRPTYKPLDTGKIKVEGKREMKKRTKTRSPNRYDAFVLTLASDAITASGTDAQPMSWKEPLKRKIAGIV